MISVRKIGVFFLTFVFFFCVPVHIYTALTGDVHTTQGHLSCNMTLVAEQFAHFHEMTNVLLMLILVLMVSVVVWYFRVRSVYTPRIRYSPYQSLREKYLAYACGIFSWLRLQIVSPPFVF